MKIKRSQLKRIIQEEIHSSKNKPLQEGLFAKIFDKMFSKKVSNLLRASGLESEEYKKADRELSKILGDYIKELEKQKK